MYVHRSTLALDILHAWARLGCVGSVGAKRSPLAPLHMQRPFLCTMRTACDGDRCARFLRVHWVVWFASVVGSNADWPTGGVGAQVGGMHADT